MNELWRSLTPIQQMNSSLRILYFFLASATVILGSLGVNKILKIEAKLEFTPPTTQMGTQTLDISPIFKSGLEACGFYNTKYKNSYPYIAINNLQNSKDDDIFVRAIAYEALWNGDKCTTNEEGKVQLIGTERTFHEIEIKSENSDFIHIANGYSIYRSKLVFDDEGRIIDRKIIDDEFKKDTTKEKISLEDLKPVRNGQGGFYNSLKIYPVEGHENNSKYTEGINKYKKERKKLHKKLANDGCAIITTKPINNEELGKNEGSNPTITFLCFNNHVRVMEQV